MLSFIWRHRQWATECVIRQALMKGADAGRDSAAPLAVRSVNLADLAGAFARGVAITGLRACLAARDAALRLRAHNAQWRGLRSGNAGEQSKCRDRGEVT